MTDRQKEQGPASGQEQSNSAAGCDCHPPGRGSSRAVGPAAPPRAVELRRHLKERGLARFKVPDRIEVVAELPRTAVGKTAGRRLREPGDDRR